MLPVWVSKRSARGSTSYLRIWGTHLRWAALCRHAWEIIFSGRIPGTTQTPPIVAESRGIHDYMLKVVRDWFDSWPGTLRISTGAVLEYIVKPSKDRDPVVFVLKPDLYVLLDTPVGPANLVVEVTTRYPGFIPVEWLTGYALGYYLKNLRPTFTILVTPKQIAALPLSTKHVEMLERLVRKGTARKPTKSLCYNCDLRQICPSPLA